jgi:integrase
MVREHVSSKIDLTWMVNHDIKTVHEILRHIDVNTTMIYYAHLHIRFTGMC